MKQTSINDQQSLPAMSFAFVDGARFVPQVHARTLPRSSGDQAFHANVRTAELAAWIETGGDYLASEPLTQPRSGKQRPLIQRLSGDADSSEVLNFPFVLAIFLLLVAGSALAVCGMCLANFWLISIGALVTSAASLAYGSTLSES